MVSELADTLVWMLRLALLAGLTWGAWLCVSAGLPPAQPANPGPFEPFAAYALLILLLTTLGSLLHAV
jgi:hypothetical protein